MATANFTDDELKELNDYKKRQEEKLTHGGAGGRLPLGDQYDKHFYEEIDIKSRQAYEQLATLTYDHNDQDELLLTYAKDAQVLDEAYGKKLIEYIKDDRKLINRLSQFIREKKIPKESIK